jgi:hypothetical protein
MVNASSLFSHYAVTAQIASPIFNESIGLDPTHVFQLPAGAGCWHVNPLEDLCKGTQVVGFNQKRRAPEGIIQSARLHDIRLAKDARL